MARARRRPTAETRRSARPLVLAGRPSGVGGRALGAVVLAVGALAPRGASADPVLAETLFQSGREALAAGDLAAACPKLAESQRLDPAGGTVLLLGLCLEKQGKLASAWAAFEDALSFALREKNDERVVIARRHLALVEPKLWRVSFHLVAKAPLPSDLVIRRDGVALPPSALDTPTPLDAGEHVIAAEAKGFARFEETFVVPAEPSAAEGAPRPAREVRIMLSPLLPAGPVGPVAEDVPSAPIPPRSEPPPPPVAHSVVRAAPWITAGAGGALLGLGAYFGFRASVRMDDVRARCPRSPCSDRGAESLRDDAGRDADRATVALIAGGVLVAGGLSWGFVRQGRSSTVSVAGRF